MGTSSTTTRTFSWSAWIDELVLLSVSDVGGLLGAGEPGGSESGGAPPEKAR